MNNLESKDK